MQARSRCTDAGQAGASAGGRRITVGADVGARKDVAGGAVGDRVDGVAGGAAGRLGRGVDRHHPVQLVIAEGFRQPLQGVGAAGQVAERVRSDRRRGLLRAGAVDRGEAAGCGVERSCGLDAVAEPVTVEAAEVVVAGVGGRFASARAAPHS